MTEDWTPRPDQQRALDWLLPRSRSLLAAPTGAGKTVLAETWLAAKMFDEFAVDKVLIVAPKLVCAGWLEQAQRWTHLRHLAEEMTLVPFDLLDLTPSVQEDGRRGALTFRDKKATKRRLLDLPGRVHVCSWDAFSFIEDALGKAWPYSALIPDESSFLRDIGSARTKAARRAVHKSGKVSHVLLLTATPNADHDTAVFTQVDLVQRGLLGDTLTEFRETYCQPDSRNWQTGVVYSYRIASAMRPAFQAACASVCLSVPESLGIDVLPVEHWVDLPPAARDDYDTLQRDQVLDVPRVTAASEAVLHNKLRQLATGLLIDDAEVAHGMHDAKLAKLAQLREELAGRPALIAYEFEEERRRIAALLGEDFADIRQAGAKERFLAGELQFLGVHPQSAGHGVDGLQARTNVIIWTTTPQVRELFDQTNGRLKRPGQAAPTVMAHMLIARGTVEERVWTEVLPAKLKRAELLLHAVRAQDSEAVA